MVNPISFFSLYLFWFVLYFFFTFQQPEVLKLCRIVKY